MNGFTHTIMPGGLRYDYAEVPITLEQAIQNRRDEVAALLESLRQLNDMPLVMTERRMILADKEYSFEYGIPTDFPLVTPQ